MPNSNEGRFGEVLSFLDRYERFAVFTHLTPDGDALGSSYAMCLLLREMGKQAVTVLLEQPPWKYTWPQFEDLFVLLSDFSPEGTQACIAVDCATKKRLSDAAEVYGSLPTLSIDHHMSNQGYADVNHVEESPATAQIVYDIFEAAGMPVSEDAAAAIYMGIIADTGNLSYPSTTAHTFEICASLARNGLDTSVIAERVFHTRTLPATKLIGSFIRNMKLYDEDRIAVSHMSSSAIAAYGARASDTEGLINYARDIVTVEVAAFLRQIGRNTFKVSLRSKKVVNVSEFAEQYGGGGHPRAAGCVLHGRRDDLIAELVEKLTVLLA